MKIIFMGTPDFAVPSLKAIVASHHEVLAVVTQPDRPRNRGILTPSPVKQTAIELGVPVLQYERISREGVEDIKALAPDIIVTCAFGQILSREFLTIPPFGVINEHASLLPKYRGSSPIQWCVLNGEEETGVTIMKTAYEVDSGDILLVEKTLIDKNETAGELFDRLSEISATAILKALDIVEKGEAVYTPQDASKATFCKMLSKADGVIDWNKSAEQINNFVRGMNPWPCAFTSYQNQTMKIHCVKVLNENFANAKAGEIISADKNGLVVACGSGAVVIEILQMPNSKKMLAKDYLLGHKIEVGSLLGE